MVENPESANDSILNCQVVKEPRRWSQEIIDQQEPTGGEAVGHEADRANELRMAKTTSKQTESERGKDEKPVMRFGASGKNYNSSVMHQSRGALQS